MTINGFIARPDDTIIGATTEDGMDIPFEVADCVHRSGLMDQSQKLISKYLRTHTLCPALQAKVPKVSHDTRTTLG